MEILDIIQTFLLYIAVTFVIVEAIKKVIKSNTDLVPGWCFFVLSIVLGIVLSYGWSLRVLPAPTTYEAFDHVNTIITGFIIGIAASGMFSGLDEMFPDINL